MDKAIAFLKSHWPAILAFIGAAWTQFGTTITAWVSAHPKYSALAAFVAFTVGYYVKSPLTPKPPQPQG